VAARRRVEKIHGLLGQTIRTVEEPANKLPAVQHGQAADAATATNRPPSIRSFQGILNQTTHKTCLFEHIV